MYAALKHRSTTLQQALMTFFRSLFGRAAKSFILSFQTGLSREESAFPTLSSAF
jgi:hypothetical protein